MVLAWPVVLIAIMDKHRAQVCMERDDDGSDVLAPSDLTDCGATVMSLGSLSDRLSSQIDALSAALLRL